MNDDLFVKSPHKNFEGIKKIDKSGIEYWEARELMQILGYEEWRKFLGVILKAKESCSESGQKIENHFVPSDKMIKIATGTSRQTTRTIDDYKLSRYACYLIAQNGDSRKKEIATAQTYFAIQTRRQEVFQELSPGGQRLFLRGEVKIHNKELNATAASAGVKNFGKFNNAGYLGLYGMHKKSVQKKKGIGQDDVLDRAGATELAANLFRITQTDEKLKKENIKGEGRATFTHIVVGQKVRRTIMDIGGTMPEDLRPEPHIKEIEKKQKILLKTKNSSKKLKS
jgi:DNA-damage-inducible protein D